MADQSFIFILFLIFGGAALLSTIALITRQSMLVAYMLLGIILGPWGLDWIGNSAAIHKIGDIGIIFLLFLLGLHLPPQKLVHMLKKISVVGVVSSLVFAIFGYIVSLLFHFSSMASLIIAAAMMFSSTIIGIKLLPTTVLHHQHTGEMMISVLLFQDILAILVLVFMRAATLNKGIVHDFLIIGLGFPGMIILAFLFEKYILMWLLSRFSRIKEYTFLLAIAWCLSLVVLATYIGLSDEIGAFIAGVSLAASPIAVYIAESLKPIRDFFLVMFFFSVGASFDLTYFGQVVIPALILSVGLFAIKPVVYRYLLGRVSESAEVGWEVGARLAQISEFSLIIAFFGLSTGLLSAKAAYLIQAATIISFIISSYFVVMRYPTPVALSDRLRRD